MSPGHQAPTWPSGCARAAMATQPWSAPGGRSLEGSVPKHLQGSEGPGSFFWAWEPRAASTAGGSRFAGGRSGLFLPEENHAFVRSILRP